VPEAVTTSRIAAPTTSGSVSRPRGVSQPVLPMDEHEVAPIIGVVTTLDRIPSLRLTSLTDCGGCAAKLGADLLSEALTGLGAEPAPDALIAGLHPPDDAAAYRVSDDLAIIGTLDFFPPLVDDPRTFGEIAAANAVSDVFAMGGRVLFALSIAAFPEELPRDVMAEIFAGASSKVREAGGTLAGGHTIRDPEPKYGLAVIGAAHPDRLLRKGGARPGDELLLTKPLGTGLLVSGQRQGRTSADDLATAIDGMRSLNRAASEVLVANGVTAATDVTGFGLLGHGLEMARASGTRLVFAAGALPVMTGALELARAGVETGGGAHNRRFVTSDLTLGADLPAELVTVAHDPQTSGGLLAAVAPERMDAVQDGLAAAGVDAWVVGGVEAGAGVALRER
jgi:selenide,water dikinase